MRKKKVIQTLIEKNDYKYNLQKAAEEFQELALVLMQLSLKPKKVDPQEVIDEIGDCKIRMKIIESFFDRDKVKTRVKFKIDKFGGYIKEGKYRGQI